MVAKPRSPLLTPPAAPRRRTSVVLESLLCAPGEQSVAFGAIVERLGDRAYGLLIILLALLNFIPLASLLAGPAIAAIGLQMSLGRPRPWLPRRLLELTLPAERLDALLRRLIPLVARTERYLRPRWQISEAPVVDRFLGLIVCLLGLFAMIPAPFTNAPPSIPLLVIGLGLAERDGLVQLLGALLASIGLLLFALLVLRVLT